MTRLNAVKAQMEENQVANEKLQAVIENCQKMKRLPPANKATESMWNNILKQMQKDVKEEVLLADKFLKQSNNIQLVDQHVNVFIFIQ